ncbi:MAG: FAD-binding oxidoreductase [Saccharothrix sp.]|nr:FAD-binding oxidoreductase [Saccharothrix sp.]
MPISRRTLFGATAAGAAVAALGTSPAAADTGLRVDGAAWRELRRVLSPTARLSPGLDPTGCAPVDNQRYAFPPPIREVVCQTEQDVVNAVKWCVTNDVEFRLRSGGHNYAGYSTLADGVVICMGQGMRRLDPDDGLLHVGGGATNSDVYANKHLNLYFPGGRCPTVGVAGLTLGGGLGFNDRKWGLTCDSLVGTNVVLANGELVRATESEHADLFWACRGGAGGNFGVNTSFTFNVQRVDGLSATVFDLYFRPEQGVTVVQELQHLLETDHHNDLDVRIGFKHPRRRAEFPGGPFLRVLGQRFGSKADLLDRFRGLLMLNPQPQFIDEFGFWPAQEYLLEKPEAKECYYTKSLMPRTWLEADSLTTITQWIRQWDEGSAQADGYVTLFAMGGATATIGEHDTAFPHREATFAIDIGTRWAPDTPAGEEEPLLDQVRALYGDLSRQLHTRAAFVNFPDPELRRWSDAYYGPNYARLLDVKQMYDPHNRFRYPQSIGAPESRTAPARGRAHSPGDPGLALR